jgi:hypothetical protein
MGKTFLKKRFFPYPFQKTFVLINCYGFAICYGLYQKRDISSKSPVFDTRNRPAGEG